MADRSNSEQGFAPSSQPMMTASVPIPMIGGGGGRSSSSSDLLLGLDLNYELELCSHDGLPHLHHAAYDHHPYHHKFFLDQDSNNSSGGGVANMKMDPFRMDDDDIFQVDKADLIQGPTLAELNANDDTLLDDLNLLDNLLTPDDGGGGGGTPHYLQLGGGGGSTSTTPVGGGESLMHHHHHHQSFPNDQQQQQQSPRAVHVQPRSTPARWNAFGGLGGVEQASPANSPVGGGALSPVGGAPSPVARPSSVQRASPSVGLHELLVSSPVGGPGGAPQHRHLAAARLSSSAPTHLSLEQIWQRREPRKHLLSTGSLAEAGSTSSLSTSGVLSPGGHEDLSQDEDSDDDSDRYEEYSSDDSDGEEGAAGDETRRHRKKSGGSKSERYFWQYNIQAKGPKGQRLVSRAKLEDPHVLNEVTDPVFSPSCSLRGIKHSGKARKGDGNDLTPNPRKLYSIGKELDNLGRIINDMTPVSELPFNVRPKTRKEKNKLASRACRLKKKAQHEANKLKLHGLQHEHRQLMNGISQIKQMIMKKCITENSQQAQPDVNAHLDKIVKSATKVKIAGNSSEYVNKILDKVKSGVHDGGINEF